MIRVFRFHPFSFVEDEPAGTNPIDWYGALSPAHGGTDACDGFAQTLVERQVSDGHWGHPTFYDQNSTQSLFETPLGTDYLEAVYHYGVH